METKNVGKINAFNYHKIVCMFLYVNVYESLINQQELRYWVIVGKDRKELVYLGYDIDVSEIFGNEPGPLQLLNGFMLIADAESWEYTFFSSLFNPSLLATASIKCPGRSWNGKVRSEDPELKCCIERCRRVHVDGKASEHHRPRSWRKLGLSNLLLHDVCFQEKHSKTS